MPTELKLSNSKIKTFRRCEKQYEFKYVYEMKPRAKARPLELGSWVHDLLMHHYDGEDWRERHRERALEFNNLFEEEREQLGDVPQQAVRMMRSYLHHYRIEDRAWKILDTELDEVVDLPNGIKFRMIIDLLAEDRSGRLWIWDHKNLKSFMPPEFMLMDAQLTRYFVGAHLLGHKVHGVLFNELRTKAPSVPPLLQSGELSQAKRIDTDYYTYAREIKRHKLDPKKYRTTLRRLRADDERFFRRTMLPRDRPVMKAMMSELFMTAREIRAAERRGEFPRTPVKSCIWDCPFLDPCMIQLQGGDISKVLKLHFEKKKQEDD